MNSLIKNIFDGKLESSDLIKIKINEILDYIQPSKYIVSSTEYSNDYDIPVLTAGKSFILGYTNETNGIFNASKEKPVIIFDDFTTSIQWVDFPFKVKSSALKIIVPKNNTIDLRFIYHLLSSIPYSMVDGEHSRQWISKYSQQEIYMPKDIKVQKSISTALDSFTSMIKELEEEQDLRDKQYNFYLTKILDFDKKYQMVPLNDVAIYVNGKSHEQLVSNSGKYILINSKFISSNGTVVKKVSDVKTLGSYGDIAMVLSDLPNGKALAKCFFVSEDNSFAINQRIAKITVKDTRILPKFLYYYLNRNKQLLKYDNGSDQTNLSKDNVLTVKIPLVPMKEQQKIVYNLDAYNEYCNSSNGLINQEIELRKKQYQYYRAKLLSF